MKSTLLLATILIALATSHGSVIDAQQQDPLITNGFVNCGGMNEPVCGLFSEFRKSNGDGCDRGLKLSSSGTCVNETRRQLLNPGVEGVYVGTNFAQNWIGRALRIQRQDLNWKSSIGRMSWIEGHNAATNIADNYFIDANQTYSNTELLDAGIRWFEWDVHHDLGDSTGPHMDTGKVPELCHGLNTHLGCVYGDRDFFNAAKELRDWMKEPGHENEVVIIGFEYRVDSATGEKLVDNAIEEYLDVPGIGVFDEAAFTRYLATAVNAEEGLRTSKPRREWPSQEWLVANGKRVILFGLHQTSPYWLESAYGFHNSTPPDTSWLEVVNPTGYYETINHWADTGAAYPECSVDATITVGKTDTFAGTDYHYRKLMRPQSSVTYRIQSDDIPNGLLTGDVDAITPDQVKALTDCNVDKIAFDNILVDHGRLQAAVWSWEINQPPVNAAGTVARMARATGRWWSTSGLEQRPFLCRKETRGPVTHDGLDYVKNLPTVAWAVSSSTGAFAEGHDACADLGDHWTFSPPLSGYENRDAKTVVENLSADPYINFFSEGEDRWKASELYFEVDAPAAMAEGEMATIIFWMDMSRTPLNPSCGAGAELDSATHWVQSVDGVQRRALGIRCRYLGGPDHTAVASLTGSHAAFGSVTRSASVSVTNRPPRITGLAPEMTVVPNQFANLVFTIDDAPGEAIPFITIDWGELGGTQTVTNLSPGIISVPHHFAWSGPDAAHEVRINVWDEAATTSETLTVRILNTAPSGLVEGPTRVSVGPTRRETFYVTTQDPDGGVVALESASCGDHGQVRGTGLSEPGAVRQYHVRCEFTSPATYNRITFVLKDDEQQSITYDQGVQVGVPPTGWIDGPASVVEGSIVQFNVSGNPTEGDDITLVDGSLSCGSGTLAPVVGHDNATGPRLSVGFGCIFGDSAVAPTTVRATVLDFDGQSEFVLNVTVTNVAPQLLNVVAPASVNLGVAGTVSGQTKDPGGDAVSVRVFWGESAGEAGELFPAANNQFSATHAWATPGTYDVVVVPIDDEGAEGAAVTRTIKVGDNVDPDLHLPTLDPIPAIGPLTPVTFDASATDNVGIKQFSCTPASGSSFAVGTHTITCTALDTSDNDVTGTFAITVVDLAKPVVTVQNVTVTGSDPAVPGAAAMFSPAPAATDNVAVTTFGCSHTSGATFPFGVTTVSCTATDAANHSTTADFTVTVLDGVKPALSVPANITVTGSNPAVAGAAAMFSPVASDNLPGASVECAPVSGSMFPFGTTPVSCTAIDAAANRSEPATFTVTVLDGVAPDFPALANLTVTGSNPAVAGAAAMFSPVATDNIGVTGITCSPLSGTTFPFGTTLVSCTASDAANNATTRTFTVTVLDGVAPVVSVPANIAADATSASGAIVTFTATALDNVSGSLAPSCAQAPATTFAIGVTIVTCSATDAAGNTGSASFTVSVNDVTTPGEMHGDGFVRTAASKSTFDFRVAERVKRDLERDRFRLSIDYTAKNQKSDRFQATDMNYLAFSDDPTYRPGRPRKTQIDTVTFSGIGEWNGQGGYRFEVFAQDAGEPGRHRESVRITVWAPSGAIVAHVEGELSGGNVQSLRIRH